MGDQPPASDSRCFRQIGSRGVGPRVATGKRRGVACGHPRVKFSLVEEMLAVVRKTELA